MDEEADATSSAGDEKFRELLGDDHPLVEVCRIWAELKEHPVVEQWGHPDRVPHESLEDFEDDEDVVQTSREISPSWYSEYNRIARALLEAHPRMGIDAAAEEARRTASETSWFKARGFWPPLLIQMLPHFGFVWEVGPDGKMPTGPGRSRKSEPREIKPGGKTGRKLFTVVVEELARALDIDPLDTITTEERERIAQALPDVFSEWAHPAPRGRLARVLQNLAR